MVGEFSLTSTTSLKVTLRRCLICLVIVLDKDDSSKCEESVEILDLGLMDLDVELFLVLDESRDVDVDVDVGLDVI